MSLFFTVLTVFLLGFLSGYLTGKRYGRQLGALESETAMPLILRQNSLEAGCCVICGQSDKNACRDNTVFAGKSLPDDK